MQFLIPVVVIISLSSAQFVQEQTPVWNGPLANNPIGELVRDTPEVAAAKTQHAQAHANARAILPELPEEQNQYIPLIQQRALQQENYVHVPAIHNQILHSHPAVSQENYVHVTPFQQHQPIHTSPQFTQLAEEIPRSSIGEVPEVAAARRAHELAFEQTRATLPKLVETVPQVSYNTGPVAQNLNSPILDTPEVAAAKLAHARAFAAARSLFH